MDSEVLDVLQELGCFSAAAGSIDESAGSTVDIPEQDPVGDLWIDIGGEG